MDAVRLGSLLGSRLCHDVIGPASAVVNGLELIEAEGGMDDEALAMIRSSATQLTNRLQFYRAAYGVAAGLGFLDARRIAAGFLTGGKIVLDWPATALPKDAPEGAAKLLLNMVLLGADLLGRGGRLMVAATATRLAVAAQGEATRVEDLAYAQADATTEATITPRSIQPFFVACLAATLGARFQAAPGQGRVALDAAF
ncbi:MAG: hypothetical protein FJX36_13150 [Alphaproteobacteria bacterium]|nr:hypothetical protein [Alphaproteobacteria bacterium]